MDKLKALVEGNVDVRPYQLAELFLSMSTNEIADFFNFLCILNQNNKDAGFKGIEERIKDASEKAYVFEDSRQMCSNIFKNLS